MASVGKDIQQQELLYMIVGMPNVADTGKRVYLSNGNGGVYSHKDCSRMFRAAVFIIAKNYQQPKCSLTTSNIAVLIFLSSSETETCTGRSQSNLYVNI